MLSSNHLKTSHLIKTLFQLLFILTFFTLPLISCFPGENADSGNIDSTMNNGGQAAVIDENQTSGENLRANIGTVGTIIFNQVNMNSSGPSIEVTTWAISPDGGDPRRIPNKTGIIPIRDRDFPYLTLSPDCARLAYIANKKNENDMNGRLMLMGTNGSNSTQLSDLPAQNLVWSPDGTRIAFVEASQLRPNSQPGEGTSERTQSVLHIISTAGERIQTLPLSQPPLSIAWSPDGKRFAFAMTDLQRHFVDIYTMNTDGTGIVNVTEGMRPKNKEDYYTPETREKVNAGQLLMSSPGFPAWSHDSKRLAYITEEENSESIWVVELQSLAHQRIWQSGRVNGSFSLEAIAWSPDDSMIALSVAADYVDLYAPRTQPRKLWLVAADGSSHRLLFEGMNENLLLAWCACQEIPVALGSGT